MWKSKIVWVDWKLNETDVNDDGDDDATPHFTDCVALYIEHTHKYIHWERASWAWTVLFIVHVHSYSHLAQVLSLFTNQPRSYPWRVSCDSTFLLCLLSSISSCSLSSTTRSSWKACATSRKKRMRTPWTPSHLPQVMSPTSWPSASSTTHQSPSPSWSRHRTRMWLTWHSARWPQRHTEDKPKTKKTWQTKKKRSAAASIEGKMTQKSEKAEAKQTEATNTWTTGAECRGSSSKVSPQTRSGELQDKTTFIVLQKNTRSMNSSERLEELFGEIHQVA